MSGFFMKYYKIITLVVVGAVFIFSAFTKLYPIEIFELSLVDFNLFSERFAPFFARIIIGFEIFVGVGLISQLYTKFFKTLALATLSFFTLFLIYILISKGNELNCGCFGSFLYLSPLSSIFKNLFLVLLLVFPNYNFSFNVKRKLKLILVSIFFLFGFSMPFILNPISFTNTISYKKTPPNELDTSSFPKIYNSKSKELLPQKGKKIVAFLSTTCQHCKNAAYKLKIAENNNPNIIVLAYFIGKKEEINDFFKESNSNFPYAFFKSNDVFKITEGKFPLILYVEEGIVKKQWRYNDLKIQELENLFL